MPCGFCGPTCDMFTLAIACFAMFFALILSAGQLIIRNKQLKNYMLAGIYFCLALLLVFFLLIIEGLYMRFPHLYRVHTPFTFALGPLLYLFFKSSLDDDFNFRPKDTLHFLPFFIALSVFVPFFLQGSAEKVNAVEQLFHHYQPSFHDYFAFVSNLVVFGYMLALVIEFSGLWKFENLRTDNHARWLLALLVFAMSTTMIGVFIVALQNLLWLRISMYMVTFILVLTYLVGQRYPEFLLAVQQAVNQQKYQRSVISGLDFEKIEERLDSLMQGEQLYKQDDLSLAELAGHLELSKHQLSEFLNSRLKMSFFHYINSVRIAEASQWLLDEPTMPILDIAYSVGFNSKSSFNSAFNRVHGMTPRQFRKNNRS